MPYGGVAAACRGRLAGAGGPVLPRAVFYAKAKGSNGTLTDGKGLHAIQHGSTSGADTNDPLWLPYAGTQYLYLPGVSGNYASVPDSAALSITGDIDLRIRVALDDWTATQTLMAKQWAQFCFRLRIETSGKLVFRCSLNGTTEGVVAISSAILGFAAGTAMWLRVTRVAATGVVTHYTSVDGSAWTQITQQTLATGNIFDSTDPVEIGDEQKGTSTCTGKFYRAQMYSGVGGTLALDADFTDAALFTEPHATFTEKSANAATVTVNRSASGRKATAVDRDCYLLGTDDYFEIADTADLNFALNESLTVCVLVRLHGTSTNQMLIVKKVDSTTGAGYSLDRASSNIAKFAIADGTNRSAVVIASAVTQGVATLISGVRNVGTDQVQAFSDGTGGTATTDISTGTLNTTQPLWIGKLNTGFSDFVFFGAVLFREALTAADLVALKAELLS